MSSRSTARVVGDLVEVTWPLLSLLILSGVVVILPSGSPLRLVVALVAMLTLPGYVLSLATFPLSRPRDRDGGVRSFGGSSYLKNTTAGSDWSLPSFGATERWFVSVGFSIGLVPVYGLVISGAAIPFEAVSILAIIVALSSVFTFVAFFRRLRLPDHVRDRTPGLPSPTFLAKLVETPTRRGTLSNSVIVVGFLVAAGSLGVAITVPAEDPEYTSVSLLTENESGALVSADYPYDLQPGESGRLVFVLTNREDETVDYSVVVQTQQVDREGNVVKSRQLNRFIETVRDEETWERPHQITPQMRGDRMRVVYLVYRGTPPADPTMDSSYRTLTLWIREPMPQETSQTASNASVASSTTGASNDRTALDAVYASGGGNGLQNGRVTGDSATLNNIYR